MTIAKGSRVRIVGLLTDSGLHLNGTTATVIRWDSKLDRWRLTLADGKSAALQARNVEAADDDDFATGPPAVRGSVDGANSVAATPAAPAVPTPVLADERRGVVDLCISDEEEAAIPMAVCPDAHPDDAALARQLQEADDSALALRLQQEGVAGKRLIVNIKVRKPPSGSSSAARAVRCPGDSCEAQARLSQLAG